MPKDKPSGFKNQTNEERKVERDERKYKDFDKGEKGEEDRYFKKDVDKWLKDMTDDERHGIQTYTGHTYDEMNSYLRNGEMGSGNSYLEDVIKNATDGLSKFKLKENLRVYRKSDDDLFSELGISLGHGYNSRQDFIKEINGQIGSIVQDKGFTSTATRSNVWSGRVHMEIFVPKGTSGAYVRNISYHSSEYEFLLNRGTRFKILGAYEKDTHFGKEPCVRLIVVR